MSDFYIGCRQRNIDLCVIGLTVMTQVLIITIIMISYAPISSKIEDLVIIYQCAIRRRMYEGARNLRKIGSFKEIGFRRRRNEATVTSNLILAENEF